MTQTLEQVNTYNLMPTWNEAEVEGVRITLPEVAQPIDGDPAGKNLLSMLQLSAEDIYMYLDEARAAETLVNNPGRRGINLLPFAHMDVVMRQPSTRTGGSMTTAMAKLGGTAELISGMVSSSEAKGESRADSDLALATQSDILAIRTADNFGPVFAAQAIEQARRAGKFPHVVPIINLGDGKIEHPTQALGDLYIMQKYLGELDEKTVVIVGDHERYRAHHSLLIGAVSLGMNVISVESPAAPLPKGLVTFAANRLKRTTDLDAAMQEGDVLYMGRNPDEYDGNDPKEIARSEAMKQAYAGWVVDNERLQQMHTRAVLLHPRPRRNELHPSIDTDVRAKDVEQMKVMISMRMAVIAQHAGYSIKHAIATA